MRLRSVRDQQARISALDLDVSFHEGEEMRTEISAKFRTETIRAELADARLHIDAPAVASLGDITFTPVEDGIEVSIPEENASLR